MAIQFDVATRNARLDAIEDTCGSSPVLKIRTGLPPANCAMPDSGTVIATLNLPDNWLSAAASGVKSMNGTWQDLYADASGVARHFRIYDSGGTCRMQGTVGGTATGDGDMLISQTGIAAGVYITVTAFTLTEQNS